MFPIPALEIECDVSKKGSLISVLAFEAGIRAFEFVSEKNPN